MRHKVAVVPKREEPESYLRKAGGGGGGMKAAAMREGEASEKPRDLGLGTGPGL